MRLNLASRFSSEKCGHPTAGGTRAG